MDPYKELLALIDREHALVSEGAWEDLAALDARRRELLSRLPVVAPRCAGEALRRAAAIQARTNALLGAGIDELRRELGTLSQGRAAVLGYGGAAAAAPAAGRLDLAG
jgi:hypothetical protein